MNSPASSAQLVAEQLHLQPQVLGGVHFGLCYHVLLIAELEYEKSIGQLRPPQVAVQGDKSISKKFITVGELLDEYVQLYGLRHWGDSYLSYSRHRIEHYIKPYIGNVLLCDLTAHTLDHFYNSLQDKPAIILKGHKATDKTISLHVIEKIHALMKSALNQAITWGYIQTNPASNITLPKSKSQPRDVWTPDQAQAAIDLCVDPILRLAMMLALGCSLRIGEILDWTWDCVDITEESAANNTAGIYINKELKRCDKSSLEDLKQRGRSGVLFTCPDMKQGATKTSLVLKDPKTASSVRTVFLPGTVLAALRERKTAQEADKELLGAAYRDYNMVLAHRDSRPYEEHQIADKLRKLIPENDLPRVVFHSLRHCSTTVKLQISGGNIKYAHTNTEDRRRLAQKMEQDFFQGCKQTTPSTSATEDETAQALRLLQDNPDMAKLIITALGRSSVS